MTSLIAVAAALLVPAFAQEAPPLPAVPASAAAAPLATGADAALPAAPSASKTAGITIDPKWRLRPATPQLKIDAPALSYQEFQRQRDERMWQDVGHRVIGPEEERQAAQRADAPDAFSGSITPNWIISKKDSVQLSFIHPAPGLDAGVGWSDRHDYIGHFRTPTEHTTFAFIRLNLSHPRESQPLLTLPTARVSSSKGPGDPKESTDDYSIKDLPPGLIP